MPWGDISDFEDEEFYGFCDDFEREKEKIHGELRKEIENKEYAMGTYGEETEEYKEENGYVRKGNELNKKKLIYVAVLEN